MSSRTKEPSGGELVSRILRTVEAGASRAAASTDGVDEPSDVVGTNQAEVDEELLEAKAPTSSPAQLGRSPGAPRRRQPRPDRRWRVTVDLNEHAFGYLDRFVWEQRTSKQAALCALVARLEADPGLAADVAMIIDEASLRR